MNNKTFKLLGLKTNRLVNSLFVGNYKTKFKGSGTEFADYREYIVGDDPKNIDHINSIKEGKTIVKIYDEERELNVYFLIDLHDSFNFEFKNKNKLEIIKELITLIGLSALKSGDKIGSYIYNDKFSKLIKSKKSKSNLLEILGNINFNNEGINTKKGGLNVFNNLNIKDSLVFYISDRLEYNDKQLKILSLKNDVILCNIFHSFENTLDGFNENISFFDSFFSASINLSNEKMKNEYRILRKNKIDNLKNILYKYGIGYMYIDENTNIYKDLLKIMKTR